LLRIYGPQVEHLIDRESELKILKRLARKHIGPRLLGTFTNGRFEEFLPSRTLTNNDIRTPDISKRIAKRMRELHDGVELLESERDAGPMVWRNWDKWVDRANNVMEFVDNQTKKTTLKREPDSNEHVQFGFVCGLPWPVFQEAVEKYRKWLDAKYGGTSGIRQRLVFSHNDVSLSF
jgi:choline kinase